MNSSLTLHNYWKPVAIAAALGFLYWAMLQKLSFDWWNDPNYSHGLLIPLIIGYILWLERETLARVPKRPLVALGGAGIVFALFALWAGTAGSELFMQRISLVLMLASIVLYFWGWRVLRLAFVSFFLLLLAIPIPTIIFNKIAFPLQLFASRCAVWAMRLFDISVLRAGNVIELMPKGATQPKRLEVVEACSGIRSLMTLVTLAVVYAYFTRPRISDEGGGPGSGVRPQWYQQYGFWRSIIIVAAAVPIAILTNALRVSGTGVLAHFYGTGIADGFFHGFSGWMIYVVAFILLFAFGWLLDRAAQSIGFGKAKRKPIISSGASVGSEPPIVEFEHQ